MIAYPMPAAWRETMQRHLDERQAKIEAYAARYMTCVETLIREKLEAIGLTVVKISGFSVEVTHPAGLALPDDWYERAKEEALAEMAQRNGGCGA